MRGLAERVPQTGGVHRDRGNPFAQHRAQRGPMPLQVHQDWPRVPSTPCRIPRLACGSPLHTSECCSPVREPAASQGRLRGTLNVRAVPGRSRRIGPRTPGRSCSPSHPFPPARARAFAPIVPQRVPPPGREWHGRRNLRRKHECIPQESAHGPTIANAFAGAATSSCAPPSTISASGERFLPPAPAR